MNTGFNPVSIFCSCIGHISYLYDKIAVCNGRRPQSASAAAEGRIAHDRIDAAILSIQKIQKGENLSIVDILFGPLSFHL